MVTRRVVVIKKCPFCTPLPCFGARERTLTCNSAGIQDSGAVMCQTQKTGWVSTYKIGGFGPYLSWGQTYPSTSPSFFPRVAYSLLSSTPANMPFFPLTGPINLTKPCMLPGTSTASPTSISRPSPPTIFGGEGGGSKCWPVNALKEAFLARAVEFARERLRLRLGLDAVFMFEDARDGRR